MEKFIRETNGFNYVFEKAVPNGATILLKVPPISPNKRGINDIGWQGENVTLYGTLSSDVEHTDHWEVISPSYEVNKTISGFKITNTSGNDGYIIIRIILN